MTDTDTGDGDADYEALIEFNYKENDDDDTSVARVYNPETQAMEENEEWFCEEDVAIFRKWKKSQGQTK